MIRASALLCAAAVIAPALGGPLDPPAGTVASTGVTQIFSLPYTISTPGSYRLARNLTATGPFLAGITIATGNVTLDLGGFTLDGVQQIASTTAFTVSPGVGNISIRNGTIQRWRNLIAATGQVHLSDLKFQSCGEVNVQPYHVISVGPNSTMSDCSFTGFGNNLAQFGDGAIVQRCVGDNGAESAALRVGNRSQVVDCVFTQAHITGGEGCTVARCIVKADWGPTAPNYCIVVGAGSTVQDCTLAGTPSGIVVGVTTGPNCIVSGCNVSGGAPSPYQAHGISLGAGSLARDCKVAMSSADSVGIASADQCTIRNCSASANGAAIRAAGSGSTIEGNTVTSSVTGISVTGGQNLIIRNTARGNTTDFAIGAGNAYGPIVNATAGGDLSAIGGSTHPQANFRY